VDSLDSVRSVRSVARWVGGLVGSVARWVGGLVGSEALANSGIGTFLSCLDILSRS